MKKIHWKSVAGWVVAIAVILGVIGYNAYENEKQTTSGKIKVYTLLPLSGSAAAFGQQAKKSIDYAIQKEEYPFDIVYVDSESEPMKGLTALQSQTISQDKPIVLSMMSSVGSVVAPYVDQKKGFLFAIVAQSIAADVASYQKVTNPIPDILNPLINWIIKSYKKIDVVYLMDEYGLAEKNYLVNQLRKNNFDNINELALPLNVKDPKNEVVKLLSTNPEAIIILGNPTLGYINLFKELHLQDFKGDIMADGTLTQPFVQKSLQSYANGTIGIANMPDIETELTTEQKNLKEELGKVGLRAYILPVQTIDALKLIKYTIENNLPFERKTYENLKNWKSISGDPVSFKDGESSYKPYLVRYSDEKFYLLDEEKQ